MGCEGCGSQWHSLKCGVWDHCLGEHRVYIVTIRDCVSDDGSIDVSKIEVDCSERAISCKVQAKKDLLKVI